MMFVFLMIIVIIKMIGINIIEAISLPPPFLTLDLLGAAIFFIV